ncbi:MAG: hypothetical protein MRY74_13935 [Neomegalonema sp.]|nr:hypothetical protein [Neomegalonema sp.]
MVGAIGGLETAYFFRPIDATAAIGAGATRQKSEAGVVDSEGRPISREAERSELALSREKRALLAQLRGEKAALEDDLLRAPAADPLGAEAATDSADDLTLSDGETAALQQLKEADRATRAHEQAHATAGGAYASAPSYEYQIGPDGRRYAIGGEVQIDISPVAGDPEATIEKMRQIERAARAPSDPSPEDHAAARQAQTVAQSARAELSAAEAYAQGRAAMTFVNAPRVGLAA